MITFIALSRTEDLNQRAGDCRRPYHAIISARGTERENKKIKCVVLDPRPPLKHYSCNLHILPAGGSAGAGSC